MDTVSSAPAAQDFEKSDEKRSEDLEEKSGEVSSGKGEEMEIGDQAKVEGGGEKEVTVAGGGEGKEKEKAEKTEPEPDFEILSNPARVLPQQVCIMIAECLYPRNYYNAVGPVLIETLNKRKHTL